CLLHLTVQNNLVFGNRPDLSERGVFSERHHLQRGIPAPWGAGAALPSDLPGRAVIESPIEPPDCACVADADENVAQSVERMFGKPNPPRRRARGGGDS